MSGMAWVGLMEPINTPFHTYRRWETEQGERAFYQLHSPAPVTTYVMVLGPMGG